MVKHLIWQIIPIIFFSEAVFAEVEELNNTEMTQAYIEDGAIVIKQRSISPRPDKEKPALDFKVGPGQPSVAENELAIEQNTQNSILNQQLNYEVIDSAPQRQLSNFEARASTSGVILPAYQTNAALAQEARVNDIVRDGLGLTDDTQITQELMVQYISSFEGETTNNLAGPQQSITANGLQISAPNPGGRLDPVFYTSGDNSMSAEITRQQVIWNLLLPKQEP